MVLHIINHFESENGISTLEERTPFHTFEDAVEYYNNLWSQYKDRDGFAEKNGELSFSVVQDNLSVSVAYEIKNVG